MKKLLLLATSCMLISMSSCVSDDHSGEETNDGNGTGGGVFDAERADITKVVSEDIEVFPVNGIPAKTFNSEGLPRVNLVDGGSMEQDEMYRFEFIEGKWYFTMKKKFLKFQEKIPIKIKYQFFKEKTYHSTRVTDMSGIYYDSFSKTKDNKFYQNKINAYVINRTRTNSLTLAVYPSDCSRDECIRNRFHILYNYEGYRAYSGVYRRYEDSNNGAIELTLVESGEEYVPVSQKYDVKSNGEVDGYGLYGYNQERIEEGRYYDLKVLSNFPYMYTRLLERETNKSNFDIRRYYPRGVNTSDPATTSDYKYTIDSNNRLKSVMYTYDYRNIKRLDIFVYK